MATNKTYDNIALATAIKEWGDKEEKAPAVKAAFFDKKMIALMIIIVLVVAVAVIYTIYMYYKGSLFSSQTHAKKEVVEIPVDKDGNRIDPSRIAN